MDNPFGLFNRLRDMYLRYLDSPFDLRYEDLVAERRLLLDTDGRLYRNPLIEPLPSYQNSGSTFPVAAQTLLPGTTVPHSATEINDVAGFVSAGLFPPPLDLYSHQYEVFEHSVVHGRDVVVTTGTGSGKTECFLLPIVASLVRESSSWAAPGQRNAQWDWWNYSTMAGSRRRFGPRVRQRGYEDRNPGQTGAALRAIVLYPFNALVEDQLMRLREALDGAQARQWLQANRAGNRFYFGRYTGTTPVSGQRTPTNTTKLRDELLRVDQQARLVAGTTAQRFFPTLDGAEMWSRWDMQDDPPDVLVTNYVMLNIMLMRAIETPVFESTRAWLAEDRTRVFHLIVDELHSYRGTPGTEVAYLMRVLLRRLGLDSDSDQLRIIASSASVAGGPSGLQYLENFFGRPSSRFRVVGGQIVSPDQSATGRTQARAQEFRQLAPGLGDPGLRSQAVQSFHAAVGAPAPAPASGDPTEQTLAAALDHIKAADALRLACMPQGPHGQIVPRFPEDIAQALFGFLPATDSMKAVEGLLSGLAIARDAAGSAPLPVRVHMFFRNLQGLWACTNPSCSRLGAGEEFPARARPCPVGSLHYNPTLACRGGTSGPCGTRILELLYCEACGETFYGGYRRPTANNNEWFLSPDHPDLEASPDRAFTDRDYDRYAVFWPANDGMAPISPQWTQEGVQRTWRPALLSAVDGRVGVGASGYASPLRGYLYYVPPLHGPNPPTDRDSALQPYPARCPRCDTDWSRRRTVQSPVRTLRTGFQKLAQVLGDTLLRDISRVAPADNRKLVVFSDSRQDAAKLSAGMRFSHYRDALRQAFCLSIASQTQNSGAVAFHAQVSGQQLTPEQQVAAGTFATSQPADALILSTAANPVTASFPLPSDPTTTYQQAAQRILMRATQGPVYLQSLLQDTAQQLLLTGINPGGFSQDVLWTDPDNSAGPWRDLYSWGPGVPAPRAQGQLSQEQLRHMARIDAQFLREAMDVIFASGRRSLESLLLGYPTTDRLITPAPSAMIQQAADGVIRLLNQS